MASALLFVYGLPFSFGRQNTPSAQDLGSCCGGNKSAEAISAPIITRKVDQRLIKISLFLTDFLTENLILSKDQHHRAYAATIKKRKSVTRRKALGLSLKTLQLQCWFKNFTNVLWLCLSTCTAKHTMLEGHLKWRYFRVSKSEYVDAKYNSEPARNTERKILDARHIGKTANSKKQFALLIHQTIIEQTNEVFLTGTFANL